MLSMSLAGVRALTPTHLVSLPLPELILKLHLILAILLMILFFTTTYLNFEI